MSDDPNSMDLPFEDMPGGMPMLDMNEALLSGGVVVLAASLPDADGVPLPAIVFRFATPTGEFHPPVLLLLDDKRLKELPKLVKQATMAARRAVSDATE